MTDSRAHPLHLVLSALVQRELEQRPGAPRANEAGPRGRRAPVVEIDPLPQPAQILGVGNAFDLRLVELLDAVARVSETVGELPVVREQERPGRVRIEPPDRHDPGSVADELDDGRPPVRVPGGRDDARGLVEEHVSERLEAHGPAVHRNPVARGHERREAGCLPVDRDPARADQLVGATT